LHVILENRIDLSTWQADSPSTNKHACKFAGLFARTRFAETQEIGILADLKESPHFLNERI
jgi:hypothetical protein